MMFSIVPSFYTISQKIGKNAFPQPKGKFLLISLLSSTIFSERKMFEKEKYQIQQYTICSFTLEVQGWYEQERLQETSFSIYPQAIGDRSEVAGTGKAENKRKLHRYTDRTHVCCDPCPLSPHLHCLTVIEQLWPLIFSLLSKPLYDSWPLEVASPDS